MNRKTLLRSPRTENTSSPEPRSGPLVCPMGPCSRLLGSARLVGLGFRGWMAGLQTADLACWERVWSEYSDALGPQAARSAVTELSCWVGTVRRSARRPIAVESIDCQQFCRDECMAVSIIAAAQNDTCPAMRACAFALVGHSDVDQVVDGSIGFAGTLKRAGVVITPEVIGNAAAVAGPVSASRH